MNDRPRSTADGPKYLHPGFMQRALALYERARTQMRGVARYGDNDAPVPAIEPVESVRPLRDIAPPREDDRY